MILRIFSAVAMTFTLCSAAMATDGGYESVKPTRDKILAVSNEQISEMDKTQNALSTLKASKTLLKKSYKKLSVIEKAKQLAGYSAKMSYYNSAIASLTIALAAQKIAHEPVKARLNVLQAKCSKLHCDGKKYPVYVIAVSGYGGGYIEKYLELSQDLKGSRVSYKTGNWNDLQKNPRIDPLATPTAKAFDRFLDQIKLEFQRMPAQSKLILIGHSLGGGAALKASQVAQKIKRKVDLLVSLDPVGELGVRLNVVKNRPVTGPCLPPKFKDSNGKERGSTAAYNSCKATAMNFVVGKNVKYFFNRWQNQEMWPIDFNLNGKINIHPGVDDDQEKVELGHSEVLAVYADTIHQLVMQYK